MSYGSSLLAGYPSSYGMSTLPSYEPTAHSSFDHQYQTDVAYRTDYEDLPFNQNKTTHRSSLHSPTIDSQHPSVAHPRKPFPSNPSAATLNDINEYAESLGTASSAARSVTHRPMNTFSNSHPHDNLLPNDLKSNSLPQSNQQKTKKKPSDEIKTKPTVKTQKPPINTKAAPKTSLSDDSVPVLPSQLPPAHVEAWINKTNKKPVANEKPSKQVWANKTAPVHEKPSHIPLNNPKKNDIRTKPQTSVIARAATYEIQNDPYFDSLPEENHLPKSLSNTTFPNSTSTKASLPFHNSSKNQKYEPPTSKRVPPTITTNSWRKQEPIESPTDPNHLDQFPHHDLIHKDAEERFREALQRLRTDRAKQQKEPIETTAKRLQYGDYVRNSVKDGSLHEVVKPSSWSDFIELKKGKVYSLSKEEKKQLHDQSKSYAERIRYRNHDLWQDQQNALRADGLQESKASNLTPRQSTNNSNSKSVSRISKQPKLKPTNKDMNSKNRSNTFVSGHTNNKNKSKQQQEKKKTVSYAKYDSMGREISDIDEHDNDSAHHSQCPHCLKPRKMNTNLYTLYEEKPSEDMRHKKR